VKFAKTLSIAAALLTACIISQPAMLAQGYTPTTSSGGQLGGAGQGQCGGRHHRRHHHHRRGGRMGGLNGQGQGGMPMQGGQVGGTPIQGGVPGSR
jgi:hypothetical protein